MRKNGSTFRSTIEQVDDIIDHSIEIESNKRMRSANVNTWTLRFLDKDMEYQFSQLREDMFKSNMLCCFIIWLFIVVCQVVAFKELSEVVIVLLTVITVVLISTSVLVMAEEFEQFPKYLQKISYTLVHNRRSRTAFICGVIIVMAMTSSASLILRQDQKITNICPNETSSPSPQSEAKIALNTSEKTVELLLNLLTKGGHITIKTLDSPKQNCSDNCLRNVLKSIEIDELVKEAENISLLNSEMTAVINSINQKLKLLNQTLLSIKHETIRQKRSVGDDSRTNITSPENIRMPSCPHPEYIVFTWILCLIALATALKLYYLIKLFLAVVMLIVYTVLILLPYAEVFENTCSG